MTAKRTFGLVMIAALIGLALHFFPAHRPPLAASPAPLAASPVPLPASKAGPASRSASHPAALSLHTGVPSAKGTGGGDVAHDLPDAALCDHIRMIASRFDSVQQKTAALEQVASTAKLQLSQKLIQITQSGPPLDKAAAHYFLAHLNKHAFPADDDDKNPLCPNQPGCKPAALEAGTNPVYRNVNEIAKLAAGSSDPDVYALAFIGCHSEGFTKNGFCSQISAAQWVHRDPDNGTALLYLIGEIGKMPKSVLEDALYRFSQAKKFDTRFSTLATFQRRELAKLDDMMQQFELMQAGQSAYTNATLPTYQPLLASCSPKDPGDPNRRQLCDAIAHRLLSDDGLLISNGIGRALARKIGWPAQQMMTIENDFDAMMEVLRLADPEVTSAPDKKEDVTGVCLASLKSMRHMEKSMALGEVALARQLLAQQPLSHAELAANYRARKKAFAAPVASSPAK